LKKLLLGCVIISFLSWVPACSKKQIKSVLDDISRDNYEKNLRKQRIENIEDPNYEDLPSYNQYQRERKKIIQDNQATIPNVK
jgi:hypothetical protein